MPLAAMPSLIPRWKKKKRSTFKELSPSDRDYLVDLLQATSPNIPRENDQIEQYQDEPVSTDRHEEEPAQQPPQPAVDEPTSTQPTPPPPPTLNEPPALPKPTFESFLRLATSTLKGWSRRSTLIPNSTKAILASNISLEINSYMKEYAAKTRAISVSSRGHIHRVNGFFGELMEDTLTILGNLERDNWIEVGYALSHQ
jgi:hypothetical protein